MTGMTLLEQADRHLKLGSISQNLKTGQAVLNRHKHEFMSQHLTSEPRMQRESGTSLTLTESQFLKWQALLEAQTGMFISVYHRSLLESNLIIRMREIACKDFDEYYQKVNSKPDGIEEWSTLLDRVMVHETRFYRNPESLKLFSKYVQNLLQERKGVSKQAINIWSVGCSSGEEPYTLAILCQEAIDNLESLCTFGISATDISLDVLAKAREGLYNSRKLLDLKSSLIDKYFIAESGNKYLINSALKKKVCFSMANMINIDKSPLRNLDVIYCQNVLIYFKKERKQIILDSLVDRLAPGGLLIIGQGEAFDWQNSKVARVPDNQTLAYIRHKTQEH